MHTLTILKAASFPGPAQLSITCSTEKWGEPGIFSHMSDVTTNEKFNEHRRAKSQRCYCPRASSRKDGQRVCVCHAFEQSFVTSVQSVCFCRRLKTEKQEQIAGVSASLPFRCTLHFVLSQRGCFKSDVYFCNAGKWCASKLITQIVLYPGSSLGSTKLGSRLRNKPLVCP